MKRVCDQNVQQDSADQMKNFLEHLDKHGQPLAQQTVMKDDLEKMLNSQPTCGVPQEH